MMALDKYKSFWSAIALHIHLESWLSQPWLSHTHIREKECTHLHSICSDSNLFHKKKLLLLVNSFCISLPTYFLFLSSLLLINLFTVKSHIIWCITSLAHIFPLRLSSKTSLIRKAQSPLSRVIAGFPFRPLKLRTVLLTLALGHSGVLRASHLPVHISLESASFKKSFSGLLSFCLCFPASVTSIPSLLPFLPFIPWSFSNHLFLLNPHPQHHLPSPVITH